jgi:hypothetical protein
VQRPGKRFSNANLRKADQILQLCATLIPGMNVELLDISHSSYIFRQQLISFALSTLFAVGLIVLIIWKAARGTKNNGIRYRAAYFSIVLTLVAYFIFILPIYRETYHLKVRGLETTGRTLRWADVGDGEKMVEYEYSVSGVRSVKLGEVVYSGSVIGGIICPGGNYIVIYDPKDPENAVIDFRRPVTQLSGQQRLLR